MPRSKSYRNLLIESLKNKDEAQSYLNAILEECTVCEPEEAQKLLLLALKNITEAQGGFTQLSKSVTTQPL